MNTIQSNTTISEMDIESPVGHPVEMDYSSYMWVCCCSKSGTTDKRIIVFFSQFSITLIIIFFCIYQLILSNSCESDQLYMSLLTLVIGIYLPNPKMRKKIV